MDETHEEMVPVAGNGHAAMADGDGGDGQMPNPIMDVSETSSNVASDEGAAPAASPEEIKRQWEWFRSTDQPQTGRISGNTFTERTVQYSLIDGKAIFEGDILLNPHEQGAPTEGGLFEGVGITGARFRWPGGRVPYEIDPGLPDQGRVTNAIAHWEANTPIRFVLRTATSAAQFPNFVRFFSGDGCWSAVGMQGGRQDISLGSGCLVGQAIHEIGHAVGLWHEQSREDRDSAIRINWQNITAGMEHNFNQHITDGDDFGRYDYGSIMHYGPGAFSKNGQPTIETLSGETVGQRNGLSAGDLAAVRALYPDLIPFGWSGWESLGGLCTDGVGVSSWAANRLDTFVTGNDRAMYHKWWNGAAWSNWENLGGVCYSAPAAVSWGPNRIDTFVIGGDRAMYHKWWDGAAWRGWESLGGTCLHGVGVSSWASNRLDCFVIGTDLALWHKWWNGSAWSGWESLGGQLYSAPTAVSWGPNRIDVFAIGGDRAMWHRWWDGSGWRGWESLGGTCTDGVGVCSWGHNRLDCFVAGVDRQMYHKWWDGGAWRGWEALGGQIYSAPAAVSWNQNRIDAFALGGDRAMWHKWFG